MAKRRNLKKEKALRNQAYARKFRKRNTGRFGKKFYNRSENNQENNSDNGQEGDQKSNSSTADASDS